MKKEIAIVLFIIRIFSSLGFGILYASLSLYLIQNLHLNDGFAISMMGIFIALHYALALVSGFVVGRWVSYIHSLILGVILQGGSFAFIYHDVATLFWGVSLFLVGSLFSATSVNMMITERFDAHDHGRERVFMWNYAGINLGNVIGFSLAGYFQLIRNFTSMGAIAMGLMAIALILGVIYKRKLADIHSIYAGLSRAQKGLNTLKLLIMLFGFIWVTRALLMYSVITSTFILIFLSLFLVLSLAYYFIKADSKRQALTFIVLAVSYALFWSLYFLIPTGLTLFANDNTNRELFHFMIPPAWFPNINSLLIILGAPLLGLLFKKVDPQQILTAVHKFSMGLLFMSVAFLLLVIGIVLAQGQLVGLIWLVLTYVFLSFAELFIAPVGFATVGKYVSRQQQSLMTGLWLSLLGFGGLFASKLSVCVMVKGANLAQSNHQFFRLFAILFGITLVISLCLKMFLRNSGSQG